MDITLAGIFVFFFLTDSFSSAYLYALNSMLSDKTYFDSSVTSGGFQALQQHPALKKCAATVLRRDDLLSLAFRVDELTGQCQSLPSFWLYNPIIKSGYAYAKRVSFREHFQPPVEVDELLVWTEAGIYNEGSRLDLFISITKPRYVMQFVIQLESGIGNYRTEILFQPSGNEIKFVETKDYETVQVLKWNFNNPWSTAFGSTKVFKISLLVNADAITMLVEDKELCTFNIIEFIEPNRVIFGIDDESEKKTTTSVFVHSAQSLGM